jgi:hypothetical protein
MNEQGDLLWQDMEDKECKQPSNRPSRSRKRKEVSGPELLDEMRRAMRVVLANESNRKEGN